MPPRKTTTAAKKVVPLFQSFYEDYHASEQYMVNWPLIKSAEKVGSYYTVTQVMDALEYYFRTRTKHDLWDFISNIDTLYKRSMKEEELKQQLARLMLQTKKRMEDFN